MRVWTSRPVIITIKTTPTQTTVPGGNNCTRQYTTVNARCTGSVIVSVGTEFGFLLGPASKIRVYNTI